MAHSNSGDPQELQAFQKTLTPDLAYKLINNAIEQQLTSVNRVPFEARIVHLLDVPLPW